ncbi:MAG: lipopolysaccharide biosynthesis protein [Clostridia bacterium]|nr:lipopolysaccharide biosynthesis protein [Clostridia bacterium]
MANSESIKQKTIFSIIWKGAERISAQLVSTIVSIVLARILTPDDYSIVSIVAIFFAFCNIFITGGLSSALIQKKDADELDYSTVLVANIVLATVLFLIMFFIAPFIAQVYNKTILIPVIRVMSVTFFINGYKSIVTANISSNLQFKKFFHSTIWGTIVSAVIGVVMALKGFGAWALVAQQITSAFVGTIILTFTTKLKCKFRFSFARFRTLFKYGGKLFLASTITVAYNEIRPIIIGINYSGSELAYYKKGEMFPSLLNSITSNTISSTLFPAMSKVQDSKATILNIMRRYFKTGSFVIFPLMLGFLAVAENFVRIVLTEKWLFCVPYIQVFCIVYMLDLIQIGNIQAIQSMGHSGYILIMEIIKKSIYFLIVLLFVFFVEGPLWLAASSILCSLVATAVNTFPNRRLLNYGYLQLLKDIFPNLIPAIIMCGVVYLMNFLEINIFLLLVTQVAVGGCVYIALTLITKNESLFYVFDLVKSIFKGNKNENS